MLSNLLPTMSKILNFEMFAHSLCRCAIGRLKKTHVHNDLIGRIWLLDFWQDRPRPSEQIERDDVVLLVAPEENLLIVGNGFDTTRPGFLCRFGSRPEPPDSGATPWALAKEIEIVLRHLDQGCKPPRLQPQTPYGDNVPRDVFHNSVEVARTLNQQESRPLCHIRDRNDFVGPLLAPHIEWYKEVVAAAVQTPVAKRGALLGLDVCQCLQGYTLRRLSVQVSPTIRFGIVHLSFLLPNADYSELLPVFVHYHEHPRLTPNIWRSR